MVNLGKLEVGKFLRQVKGKRDKRLYEGKNPVKYFKVEKIENYVVIIRPIYKDGSKADFTIPITANFVANYMEFYYIWTEPVRVFLWDEDDSKGINGTVSHNGRRMKFIADDGTIVRAYCHPHDKFNVATGLQVCKEKYFKRKAELAEKAKKEETQNISLTSLKNFDDVQKVDNTEELYQSYFVDDTETYSKTEPKKKHEHVICRESAFSLLDMPCYYSLAVGTDAKFSCSSPLAKSLDEVFPGIYSDREYAEIGDCFHSSMAPIYFMVLHEGKGSKYVTTYEDVEDAVTSLAYVCNDDEVKYLAMPRIASGRAFKLDWSRVREIIIRTLNKNLDHDMVLAFCYNLKEMNLFCSSKEISELEDTNNEFPF